MLPVEVRAEEAEEQEVSTLDTAVLEDPLKELGLEWQDWLLVREDYMRSLKKAADGYDIAQSLLLKSQKDLEQTVDDLNLVNKAKHLVDEKLWAAQKRIFDLENPSIFRHPAFWGVVGFLTGVLVSSVSIVLVVVNGK